MNQGTTNLHQQLSFRPSPAPAGPAPEPGLYLASATAHPGGGVHGAPGANGRRASLAAVLPPGLLGIPVRRSDPHTGGGQGQAVTDL